MVTARQTGHRVEDLSQRTETVQVFANADGTWTSEGTTEPERVQDDAGDWHALDTSLKPADGGFAPEYAPNDVVFSNGGDTVFASITDERGERLDFHWPTVLPKPVVDGDTATYKDALPGVGDLEVTATATGFTHNIVIPQQPDPSASVDVTIPITTHGAKLVENPGGEVTVETKTGDTMVAASRPVMYDSSENAVGDPQTTAVDTTIGKTDSGTPTMTLSPSDSFLSDPDTVYPVVVDPTFAPIYTTGDTWVQTPDYTSSQGSSDELKVGTYDGGTHKARSFLKFDNGDATWKGVHVQHADDAAQLLLGLLHRRRDPGQPDHGGLDGLGRDLGQPAGRGRAELRRHAYG